MTRHHPRRFFCLLLVLTLPVPAQAQLTVIYDTGRTEPIAPYLKTLRPVESSRLPTGAAKPASERHLPGPAQISNLLPIRSPGLAPGALPPKALSEETLARLALGNATPFFLIGADDLSLRWLHAHRAELKQLGAVGMLVQAETEEDVRRVAELAQGLPITLGSASDIARALGISHYPLLISKKGD